jgi:hypothetical protein
MGHELGQFAHPASPVDRYDTRSDPLPVDNMTEGRTIHHASMIQV